ncbi:MAG TPA: dihydrolipoyl dehydrogenase [Candidatus Acidoferrum sp.]|jgi:pyruvate/2-oxoglutarate dehydrogenase complex dihydrolipoamide dehydrogenase (E3) component|nr:dihydrolipoyl dehydrogenase [Candidatus Acidoferrum sp.]
MTLAHHGFDYDVAIIGGGSGGYAAARTAAAERLKTVVIEGGEEVGGLCILRGCMPTKALLYAAEVMHLASHAEPWGIHTEDVSFNFNKVMARKNGLIKEFADYRVQQLGNGKFKFVRAMARFADPHTLDLSTGARLTAGSFVIATGSTLAPSPLPQLNHLDCLNSDTALKLSRLPKSLIVLGGGAVAVEFAQFFARFGVRVTLIQRSQRILREFDDDASGELENVFRREGITLHTGTKLLDARRSGGRKEIVFEQNGQTLRAHADEVFYALGRTPNICSLGLDKAGVEVQSGRVKTNPNMQAGAPHIYAAGDCTGLHEIVHIAIQQGEVAAHNIAHPDRKKEMDYRLLTEIVFTEPQVAAVGLTEQRAHMENIPYQVAKYPFNDHGKSLIMEAKDGFVKLLAEPRAGEILGGACVGPVGGELIHEIIAAMAKRMTVHELAAMPHYHPTLAEIWTCPAEELAAKIPQ